MRVRLESGGHAKSTRVVDEHGRAIEGITGVRFSVKPDDISRLELDLMLGEVLVQGEATVFVRGRRISRIIYADGGEEEF